MIQKQLLKPSNPIHEQKQPGKEQNGEKSKQTFHVMLDFYLAVNKNNSGNILQDDHWNLIIR